MQDIQQLIDAAVAEATTIHTVTREDGSTFQSEKGYGSYTEGDFQVYVLSVGRRMTMRQDHYRATFYMKNAAGKFARVNRAAFEAAFELAR